MVESSFIYFQTLGQYLGLNLFVPSAGCGHVDELFTIFKQHKVPFDTIFTEQDKRISRTLLKMWTDFATFGHPTPDPKEGEVNWLR